ncbi:hypothetical protein TSMG0158 [Halocynthia phage JM-2012]|uniref:RNA polymerase beta subunit n=1 Tax=Halocynthia phage JM-2012 TaxID=1173297 RepID=UPI00025C697A|nr:RNA polymerase beta subunit [Halocynthia phage JM-2012]AFI55441.1 hypothetical protein TSMG0158 [Halocynthia phage JM-2012]
MNIAEIVNLPEDTYVETLIAKSGRKVTVECFDGSKECTFGLLAFSWAYFSFNRLYNVEVSIKQIPSIGDLPSNKLHNRLLNTGLKVVYDLLNGTIPLNEISECGYEITCNQINQAIKNLEEYAMVLDYEDYYDLVHSPEVTSIRSKMVDGVESASTSIGKFKHLQKAYNDFEELIKPKDGTNKFMHNGLVQLGMSGTTKQTQVNQGVIARGFCSDVNSDFFTPVVTRSFADGLNSPFEFAAETCSGAKAFMYQKDPMSDTEYLHRLVQMIAATFQKLVLGDCGSTVTYPLAITERNAKFTIGKYYLDEAGAVKEIRKDNVNALIGTTVNTRMVSGCQLEDRTAVCSVCASANSLNFAKGTNVGHNASTRVMGTGSQKVLGVKHEDLGSLSLAMCISPQFDKYLKLSSNNREVLLFNNKVTLAIPEKCAEYIRTIYHTDDVEKLNTIELSQVNHIELASPDEEGNFGEVFSGSVGDAGEVVNMTPALLRYLKEDHTRLVMRNYKRKRYYFIDMSEFEEGQPVFLAPFKHFDMLNQHKLTKRFLYSPSSKQKDIHDHGPCLTDYNTFGEAAQSFLDITQEKLGIKLAVLEMAIYAFTISDANDYDFRPVRNSNSCQFMPMEQLYNNRSLAAKIVSEKQLEVLKSPLAITNDKRSDHPYDRLYLN